MSFTLPDRLQPGSAWPLGATADGLGVNFAVFSASASRIDLCIFDARGRKELARLPLPECTDEVWHGYLPDAGAGLLYGYRAHGPYDPRRGHRFNPHKLLLDPYARQLSGPLIWADALFGYRPGHPRADLSIDRRDSAPAMPKAVVVDDAFNWGSHQHPAVPWHDTVIYEAHLRGLSMQRGTVRPPLRGSFAALADPRFIEHLLQLGITTVELLPVQAFLQDRFLVERGLRNYWGYSTLAYFAPEPGYLSGGVNHEMQAAIRRLHAAGIEVIMDVVYNHTCEGNQMGPTLSWRGLDNASYYQLVPGEERYYIDHAGCGNTLNLTHPRVLQMVLDSLRHWATTYRIDGFRFDLGVTLGREANGFDPGSGFFDAIRQDPLLSRLKLISEPWDLGPGGYQLGNHPPGFSEWNDKYRDAVRRYWRGDPGQRPELASRLTGSGELFDRRHRRPWSSINFLASHDGFTLRDVVSYDDKHNDANGEENRDGHGENFSHNRGVEGPTDDQGINDERLRLQRAMLATLLLSFGTPMLLAGDEFGNSQDGNNNAYCQDNPLAWLDWEQANTPAGRDLTHYVSHLTALRRDWPSMRGAHYRAGDRNMAPGIAAITWFDASGQPVPPESWDNPDIRTLALRRAQTDDDGQVEVTLLLMNAGAEDVDFTLPEPALAWETLLDSAVPARAPADPASLIPGATLNVQAHGVLLLGSRFVPESL